MTDVFYDVRDELAVTSHKVYEIIIEVHEIKEWINTDWSTLTFIYVCILKGIRLLVQQLDSPTVFYAIWKLFARPTTIAGEGLQILTNARHSWLLRGKGLISEATFTCHTNCDTGLPFIMAISEDPWHSHLLPNGW